MVDESKPTFRERLKSDEPIAPVTVTPPKKSNVIPAWMRQYDPGSGGGGGGGTDRDGQVLNPSADQRSTAGFLSGISPRGPGK